MDATGYGGPNTYFTTINGSQRSGRVNFVTPLAPKGGSTYFSLENALKRVSPICAEVCGLATRDNHDSYNSSSDGSSESGLEDAPDRPHDGEPRSDPALSNDELPDHRHQRVPQAS
jgi:hypothetical protein